MKRYYTNMDNVSTEKAWKQFRRWRAERKVRLKQKDYSYVVPQVEPDLARQPVHYLDRAFHLPAPNRRLEYRHGSGMGGEHGDGEAIVSARNSD